MKKTSMAKKIGIGSIILALIYGLFIRTYPYVVYYPGSADPTQSLITVQEQPDQANGKFYLTTVSVYSEMLGIHYLYFKLRDDAEILPQEDVYRPGEDEDIYFKRSLLYANASKQNAVVAAYEQAKIPYAVIARHTTILAISKQSDAWNKLKVGDQITSVNDKAVENRTKLGEIIRDYRAGESITVGITRDEKSFTKQIKLMNLAEPGQPAHIGIGLELLDEIKVEPKQKANQVTFEQTQTGGPSAGLMYALEIYNQLLPGDLTKGRKIAGTGEISIKGEVGEIGGVAFKVAAAQQKGAKIFLAPEENAKEAKQAAEKAGGKIEVVSVRTLQEAIAYLRTTGD